MIHYQVLPNPLREGEYFPRVLVGATIQMQQVVAAIVRETGVSETDVKAVTTALSQQVVLALLDGNNIAIEGLATFSLSLSEKLITMEAEVSNAVEVRVNARADATILEQVSKSAHFNKVVKPDRAPILAGFADVATGQPDKYTAGSIGTLSGEDLKFDTTAIDEGVFFVVESVAETRATVYSRTSETKLDFLVPPGLAGTQTVEVRTRYTTNRLRAGTYRNVITPILG